MKSVLIERQFQHSQAKIWRALTNGTLIKEWLMENDFEAVVGHRFRFRSTPVPGWDGIIEAEVLAVEPTTKLSYTWASMGVGTVVEWTLTPTAGGTLLRMEQSGFGEDQEQNYKGATYGWQRFIGNLEKVVNEL